MLKNACIGQFLFLTECGVITFCGLINHPLKCQSPLASLSTRSQIVLVRSFASHYIFQEQDFFNGFYNNCTFNVIMSVPYFLKYNYYCINNFVSLTETLDKINKFFFLIWSWWSFWNLCTFYFKLWYFMMSWAVDIKNTALKIKSNSAKGDVFQNFDIQLFLVIYSITGACA